MDRTDDPSHKELDEKWVKSYLLGIINEPSILE
jgi:hypothetical protein